MRSEAAGSNRTPSPAWSAGPMRPAGPVGPLALAVVVAGIFAGSAALHAARPFQRLLGAYTTDLEPRSPEQRHNIAEGARRLDGAILEPGGTLSFNRVVGPRTRTRGFVPAPAFLEGARLESIGGGICQVASTLYNAALLAGLEICERVPHDRVVASVPPGADATVWYGKADLAIANRGAAPLKVEASCEGLRLRIAILGQGGPPATLLREILPPPRPGTLRVRTVRLLEGQREIVSDDVYRSDGQGLPGAGLQRSAGAFRGRGRPRAVEGNGLIGLTAVPAGCCPGPGRGQR